MSGSLIGKGLASYPFAPVTGTIRRFETPQDVIASIEEDLEVMVALVRSGGTTFLSPILGRLGGIVACDGTLRSHLAIVSREFEVPCLVGVELLAEIEDGSQVTLVSAADGTGTVSLAAQQGAEVDRSREESAVSDRWWAYIRRVGDEISVKKFDVAVSVPDGELDELIAEPLTDDKLDDLIQHMGRAFKPEMTRRSAFTSELFPMLPYMSLSVIEDFHTYGPRVATIDSALPAQEIGRRLRLTAGSASPLWTWMAGYHYLCGRECLIRMGRLGRGDRIEEIRTVVDFWRRLALAQRGDGTLDNKDAGFTNRYLPDAEVVGLLDQTEPLTDAGTKTLKRLNATVAGYSFLHFTDSRVGIYDSGPYPAGGGRLAIVRDYLCLKPSVFEYPWAAGLEAPCDSLTLVLVFDPRKFTSFEINDWGTTFTEPDQLLAEVGECAVILRDSGGARRVAPEELPGLITEFSKAHMELYRRFADMDRNERILSATRMYCWGLKPFAAMAEVTDRIDWSISPDTLALYPDPLGDDDQAAAIFGTALVANDMPGSFSPLS